ncbi:MAG: hypothetical protein PHR16_05035 [Methylovulum sp.]|nr:hypothetical protein [Methylovulum sp.]
MEQQSAELALGYQTLAGFGIQALHNGLSDDENRRLFVTVNHEEAIGLVLKACQPFHVGLFSMLMTLDFQLFAEKLKT